MGDFFNTVFVHPLLNVLVAFYKVFEGINAPGKLGLAIITFTVFVRLVMYPLFKKQMDTTNKLNSLKPELDKLNQKYKDDKQKLQQEQLRLYQEAGINPAAGCMLAVVQIPVFIGLYNALNYFVHNGQNAAQKINELLYSNALNIKTIETAFIGFDLTKTPNQAGVWYYYTVPVITAILQYFQASTMTMAPTASPSKDKKELATKEEKDKPVDTSDEFQRAMQTQMKYMFPVMIGFFSLNFPVALSLYWNVFSLFSIIQYYLSKGKDTNSQDKKNGKN